MDDGTQHKKIPSESNFLQITSVKFLCRKCEKVRKSKIHFENLVQYIECPECKSNWIIEINIKEGIIERDTLIAKPPYIKIKNATEQRVVDKMKPKPINQILKKQI